MMNNPNSIAAMYQRATGQRLEPQNERIMALFANEVRLCVEADLAKQKKPTEAEVRLAAKIEERAKEVYAAFAGASEHPWIEGGNSDKQEEARHRARVAIVRQAVSEQ